MRLDWDSIDQLNISFPFFFLFVKLASKNNALLTYNELQITEKELNCTQECGESSAFVVC